MKLSNLSIKFKDYLVIGEIHLGYELELRKQGYNVPSQVKRLLKKIRKLKGRSKKIIVLGDFKHTITHITKAEERMTKNFLEGLKTMFDEITIVKGNHDPGLENVVDVKVIKELIIDDIGFTHGHSTPSKKLMECKRIITSHVHPSFYTQDELGVTYTTPCWIIGNYKGTEIIVMPAFNELLASIDFKEVERAPIMDTLEDKEVYLKDLTKII
jgi:putative SbcD/Mre11-related phosphoesterase